MSRQQFGCFSAILFVNAGVFAVCRHGADEGYHLDSVLLAAAPTVCTVPVIWQRASGSGIVWVKAMYEGLGVRSPTLLEAQQQLKTLGARLCTVPEKQLLLTLPGVHPSVTDIRVIDVDSASQWLRMVGQPEAASQLSRHRQPLRAAADSSAARPETTGPAPASKEATAAHDATVRLLSRQCDEQAREQAKRRQSGCAPEQVRIWGWSMDCACTMILRTIVASCMLSEDD